MDLVPALVRLLSEIGRRRPVVLVLGDLCDADARSLDVIVYLAHLAADRRWLLLAAAGDEELEPGTTAARLLGACMRAGLCRRIELPCLTRAQCDELVTTMLPLAARSRDLLDQIYALTCGNPLFTREVADDIRKHAYPDAGEHEGTAPGIVGGRVPARVRSLAQTQLASLDGTVQRVLCLAAAAGTAEISMADLRVCAAVLDPPVGEGALLDALDRAVELRLLEERGTGYAFRRPLVRWALYERLSRHRRAQLDSALDRSRRAGQAELTVSPGTRSARLPSGPQR
jgi:predicted ATPase